MITRWVEQWRKEKRKQEDKFMVCPRCHHWGPLGRCAYCGFDAGDPKAVALHRSTRSEDRAKRRAFLQQFYTAINGLFAFHGADFVDFLRTGVKWAVLGAAVGALAGTASWIFLISLAWAIEIRLANPWLLLFLPVAGFVMGWLYYQFGGTAVLGNNLVIDEVNNNRSKIPLRMAPLVLLGTVVTQLFGGSAGREGTAIQMGASLADALRRVFNLGPEDRRLMIMAGISGGFGSVFGVPAAGFVFGMEVQSIGRIRYDGIIPCLVASVIGDLVARAWGTPHAHYPQLPVIEINLLLMLKVGFAAIIFGLVSMLFVELTHGIKHVMPRISRYTPLYPVIGGVVIILLTWLVGTEAYLGLSLPLIQDSLDGTGVPTAAFLLKLLFTAVTIGTGFLGGEVTPLFVIGSTLGYALAGPLGVDSGLLASVGMMAVFAGASNTPLACAIMGVELFGGGGLLYLFLGTVVAYLASGHRGIYATQPVHLPKSPRADIGPDEDLGGVRKRRGGWLPEIPSIAAGIENRPVRAIMTTPPVVVRADATTRELVTTALRQGVRAVPVVDNHGKVVGIVSDNDLARTHVKTSLRALQQMSVEERNVILEQIGAIPVQQIMTYDVVTTPYVTTLATAVAVMRNAQIKRLPVVDQAGHIEGLLTRSDILREVAFSGGQDRDARESPFDWSAHVGEVEMEPAATVAADASLEDVVRTMQASLQLRVIVVNAAGNVIGMISESDLLTRTDPEQRDAVRALLEADVAFNPSVSYTAADLMTSPVITVGTDDLVVDAIQLLIDNRIKRLPVVSQAGQVIGLVSRRFLLYGLFGDPEPPTVK